MKKTAIILAMLIIFSCTAFCQENGLSISVSLETYADSVTGELKQTLTVGGEAPATLNGKNIGLLVLRPGVSPEDAADPMNYLAAAYQSEIADNAYEFIFEFDDVSGEYSFLVFADTVENAVSTTHNIPSVQVLGDFLSSVNNRTITASDMANEITQKSNELTIDATVFDKLDNTVKEKICEKILGANGEISINNFFDLFKENLIITGINESDGGRIKTITEYYEDELEFKDEPVYAEYEKLNNKTQVYTLMENYPVSSYNDAVTAFRESALIGAAREVLSYQNILPLLKLYRSDIGNPSYIDTVDGKDPDKQTRILNSVGGSLADINNLEELEDAFLVAIAQADVPAPDIITPAPGAGGGGGGGGTSHKVTEDEKEEEKPQEKPPVIQITFDDLSSAKWAEEAILSLNEKGIVSGNGQGKFNPLKNITRAEFVKIIMEAFEIDTDNSSAQLTFDDVSENNWYYEYVKTAVSRGIVNGKSQTCFGAQDNITRQDMATLIYRALTTFKQIKPVETVTKKFSDYQEISVYARNSVLMLSEYGIINGFEDGSFRPAGNATRAEAAQLIYNVLEFTK